MILPNFLTVNGATVTIGVDAVQTLTSTATGGTFTLTFGGQTTASLPFGATAAQVATALNALSNIGGANVVCTGGPLTGVAIVITFAGTSGNTMGGQPQTAITPNNGSLTGGVASVAATTTVGVTGTYRGAPGAATLIDQKNGVAYTNTGTACTPVWTPVTPTNS